MTEQVYPIIPPSGSTYLFLIPLAILLLASISFISYSLSGARRVKFILSDGSLRISAEAWGRKIPENQLRWQEARAVDLTKEAGFRPKRKETGTNMPGYRAGWFQLQDDSKALLFVTDKTHVVWIPTTEGYSVMLSVADPGGFIATARRR